MNGTSPGTTDGISGTLMGVLVLVVLVIVAVLWGKLKDYGRAKAEQHVFARRDHRDGQQLVAEELHFTLASDPGRIRDVVLSSVRLAPQCPAVLADAYVLEATDSEVVVAYGSALSRRNFTASLRLSPAGAGDTGDTRRVDAVWGIRTWTLSDGVTDGVSVMRRLREDVEAALRGLDPGLHRTVRSRR
ncbi:hypothetical protein OIA45_24675 [Streptomyces chartreusis]|uniref:hypothetical protein n=1 Tax=Streptomyces chartreusis TaxID=1969 RepID=UPI0038662D8D|nr:hypothetical protein OIA45_24675 [Streptomyces chartreusis]